MSVISGFPEKLGQLQVDLFKRLDVLERDIAARFVQMGDNVDRLTEKADELSKRILNDKKAASSQGRRAAPNRTASAAPSGNPQAKTHVPNDTISQSSSVQQATASKLQRTEFLSNKAIAHSKKQEWDAVIAAYDAALQIQGITRQLRAELLYNKAIAHSQKQEWDAVIAVCDAALQIQGITRQLRAELLYNKAIAHSQNQEWDEAIAACDTALQHPISTEIRMKLNQIRQEALTGKETEAAERLGSLSAGGKRPANGDREDQTKYQRGDDDPTA